MNHYFSHQHSQIWPTPSGNWCSGSRLVSWQAYTSDGCCLSYNRMHRMVESMRIHRRICIEENLWYNIPNMNFCGTPQHSHVIIRVSSVNASAWASELIII